MKEALRGLAARTPVVSPWTVFALGVCFVLLVAGLDLITPSRMSFSFFYLLAAVVVGWRGGKWHALLLSTLTVALIGLHESTLSHRDLPRWSLAWNIITGWLVLASTGWITAELSRGAREAFQRSEMRLRTIITGAPIIVFSGDCAGAITFQAGEVTRGLIGPSNSIVEKANPQVRNPFPCPPEDIRRVLSGQEFRSVVEIGDEFFECWYSPARDQNRAISGYVGVATNITERYRLEREILEIGDRERERLGQDIHDGLCQQLVSLAFDANSLEQQLTDKGRADPNTARRLARLLDEAISEARQLARGLFPVRLEQEGLPSVLEELAASTQERFLIYCRFEAPKPANPFPVVAKGVATHLYRIAQEAVTNAVRHAQAKLITLRLEATVDQFQLAIEDDGKGIVDSPNSRGTGMGLHIMDYRARRLGGVLEVRRGRNGGTTIFCCVPRPRG